MNDTTPVWDRVHAQSASDASGLEGLIAAELTDAATYLLLSRRFSGSAGQQLRLLHQQEQAHANCLKGIYNLLTGDVPRVSSPAPALESPEITLRRCYGREMHALAAYEARSADPRYGAVYQKLAQQEREHCRTVLELIGQLQK